MWCVARELKRQRERERKEERELVMAEISFFVLKDVDKVVSFLPIFRVPALAAAQALFTDTSEANCT
jgi:hypothetical protein